MYCRKRNSVANFGTCLEIIGSALGISAQFNINRLNRVPHKRDICYSCYAWQSGWQQQYFNIFSYQGGAIARLLVHFPLSPLTTPTRYLVDSLTSPL
ncbi:unnamed protein product [Parnassius mnemosyne]|uniref:Uncharacterized protein n=1 Tax=Parnassius mnemosyne TaxID=213953 RepID=A0AAV1KAB2_9NEOP